MGGGPKPYYEKFKVGDKARQRIGQGQRVFTVTSMYYWGGTILCCLDKKFDVDQNELERVDS